MNATSFLPRLVLAAAVLFLGLATAVRAAEYPPADRDAIQATISNQIDAFLRDDEAGAYSFASPGIKQTFPTVDQFMNMVKKGFQPVYRPQSRTFGPLVDGPSGPTQRLFVTGPDGKSWIAEYTLEKQPDGSWLIKGCKLVEDPGASI